MVSGWMGTPGPSSPYSSGSLHQVLYLVVSVRAVCGGEITLTTDMLTTDVPLTTHEPSYLFASPGRSSHMPGSFPEKVSSLSLKCKQPRRNGITVEKNSLHV